jgi:hypothetical protein
MKGILILILLCTGNIRNSTAQIAKNLNADDITIDMVGNFGDFKVFIAKEENVVKLKFQVKDSVSERKLAKDPKYKNAVKASRKIDMNSSKGIEKIRLWLEGIQKYSVYSSDSLKISADSVLVFTDLLHRIGVTKKEELVNKNLTVIDGFTLNLAIRTSEEFAELEAHSPHEKTSPLLKDLLHQLVLFSKTTKKNLLQRTVVKSY